MEEVFNVFFFSSWNYITFQIFKKSIAYEQ